MSIRGSLAPNVGKRGRFVNLPVTTDAPLLVSPLWMTYPPTAKVTPNQNDGRNPNPCVTGGKRAEDSLMAFANAGGNNRKAVKAHGQVNWVVGATTLSLACGIHTYTQ